MRTSGSSDLSSASQKSRKAKLAKLKVQQQTMRKEAELLLQQQKLEFRVAEVRLEGEIAAAEAEDQVYEEEAVVNTGKKSQRNVVDEAVPGTSQEATEKGHSRHEQADEALGDDGQVQAVRQTPSEVSFRTPERRRLPEVPVNLPSTVPDSREGIPRLLVARALEQGTPKSEVSIRTLGRRRLPEVPTSSRLGLQIAARRSSGQSVVQRHERREDPGKLSRRPDKKATMPDVGSKVGRWGIHVPGDQTLPATGSTSTSSQSTECVVTKDKLMRLVGALQSPRVVIELFNGDPAKYPSFVRTFDESVENIMLSGRARLTRLIQLCTGKAAAALQGCAMMP